MSGTPGAGDIGNISIKVTANDGHTTVSDTFAFGVTAMVPNTEFLVNDTTFDEQSQSATAALLANGNYVVTWDSYNTLGGFGTAFAKVYTDSGVAVTAEFQVSTATGNDQYQPHVTGLTNGDFVVTWAAYDGNGANIYGQEFNAAGATVGSLFQINSDVTSADYSPSITALTGGGFAVAFNTLDADGMGVAAQVFGADGLPVGSQIQLNTNTHNDQNEPVVAGLANGGFVAMWNDYDGMNGVGADHWGGGVFAQLFDASGQAVGTQFQVNTQYISDQVDPAAAALTDGSFVATWQSMNQDGDSWGIFSQHFAADGTKIGSEFQVNATTANFQYAPSVAALADGGFIETWTSNGQDGDGLGIYAQRFAADGSKLGGEFQVNTLTNGDQYDSHVTGLDNGNFAVSWTDTVNDGSSSGVFSRVFDLSHFVYGATGDQTLTGTSGNDIIFAGTGNDTIIGGAGNDSIDFGFLHTSTDTLDFSAGDGHDTVSNFNTAHDVIDVTSFGLGSFANVASLITEVGVNAVISFATGEVITLTNVDHNNLHGSNFLV